MKLQLLLFLSFLSLNSFSQAVVSCNVYGSGSSPAEWNNTAWFLDGNLQEYSGCGSPNFYPSIHVAVIDNGNCEAWQTECGENNNYFFSQINRCNNCRSRAEKFFIFRLNDPASMAFLDSMLTNPLLNGQNILLYSMNCTNFAFLNSNYPNTAQIFQNLGFVNAQTHTDKVPFIYFAEVGNTASAIEVYGQDSTSYINLTTTIQNCGNTLSIDETSEANPFYPTVLKSGEMINLNYEAISLYDLSGKILQQKNEAGNSYTINGLSTGIYLVKVKNQSKEFVQKIAVIE